MKYIVELKEAPARKLLRYALWTILVIGLAGLVGGGLKLVVNSFVEGQNKASSALLVEFSPPQAIALAEKIYRLEPNEKTRLALLKMAVETKQWELADALLDTQRPAKDFATRCYDIMVCAQVSPDNIPFFSDKPTAAETPQADEERLLLVKTAAQVNNPKLNKPAQRAARTLESDFLRDRVTLYLGQIALNQKDFPRAKELALGLLTHSFSPGEAIKLLSLFEALKLPEADDYRSTLKVASRNNVPMALTLSRHLAATLEPAKIADWITSLPQEVSSHPELQIKAAELLYLAGKTDEAVAALDSLGDGNLKTALTALLRGMPVAYKNLTPTDLTTLARFLEALDFPVQEIPLLTELNKKSPTLWSLQAAVTAAEAAHDERSAITALEALEVATDHAGVVRAKLAYWKLILSEDSSAAKASYEDLKRLIQNGEDRPFFQATLALAHYRLGNLTDALLALPKEPTSKKELLISSFLLAKAGQYEKAGTLFKEIPANKLSAHEAEIYTTTTKLLQSNAPLQRALELLKQN